MFALLAQTTTSAPTTNIAREVPTTAGSYAIIPLPLPGEAAWVFAAVLWAGAILLAGWTLVQGILYRRRLRATPLAEYDLAIGRYPTLPAQPWMVMALAIVCVVVTVPIIGKPGTWQGCLLAAYACAVMCYRNYHGAVGAFAFVLATMGMLGMPMAFATELRPPNAAPFGWQQVLMLFGVAGLLISFIWAMCARKWAKQVSATGPISAAHKLTWAALIAALASFVIAIGCLAVGFRTPPLQFGL